MARAALASAAVLLAASAAAADVLKVPSEDYPTIQDAVNAAVEGDVVLVAKGTYAENVLLEGKSAIQLRGVGMPVIDVEGVGSHGIELTGCTDVRIQGFEVRNAANDGIRISDSTDCHAFKCSLANNGRYGVKVRAGSTFVSIQRCTFTEPGQWNIWITTSGSGETPTSHVLVSRNVLDGEGISFDAADVEVVGNRIDSWRGVGVRAFLEGATGAIIASNRLTSSAEESGNVGIHVYAADAYVGRNVLSGRLWPGIEVLGANALVERNRGTGLPGALVSIQGSGANVARNAAKDCGDVGFRVEGNDGTWVGNRSTGAGEDGFRVSGSGNTFEGNRATGSGDFDLRDGTFEGNNTYDGNRFGTIAPLPG
jgi:hypothetical protein